MNPEDSMFQMGHLGVVPASKFGNPWLTTAASFMPTSIESAWDYALFLFMASPELANGFRRVSAHFLTEISAEESHDGDRQEKKDWTQWSTEELGLLHHLGLAGIDRSCYGNAFYRVAFPFERFLVDTRDGRTSMYAINSFREEDMTFNLSTMTYTVPDPRKAGKGRISLGFRDQKSMDRSRIRLVRLDPRRVIIRKAFMSDVKDIIYMFDPQMLMDIRSGRVFQANETPMDMLDSIRKNQYFQFERGEVFHFWIPAPTGVSKHGWGMPPVFEKYKKLHRLALYDKIDEAVAMDFMMPFRVITPTATMDEVSATMDSGMWQRAVAAMADARRQDPTSLSTFPIPVTFQEIGGDGQKLVTKDLMEYQSNAILDACGVPVELFKGSTGVQAIPTTLRFFEGFHFDVQTSYAAFVSWVSTRIRNYLKWAPMRVTLMRPLMADSLENKQLAVQLAASGELPRGIVMRMLGLGDPADMNKQRMEEDLAVEKLRAEMKPQFEAIANGGALGPSGADTAAGPAGGGGAPPAMAAMPGGIGPTPENMPITPLDIQQQAQAKADELLAKSDPSYTKSELRALEITKPEIYYAVKQLMEDRRAQASSEGRKNVGQMVQQLPPPSSGPPTMPPTQ